MNNLIIAFIVKCTRNELSVMEIADKNNRHQDRTHRNEPMVKGTLPLPIHYGADKVGDLWRVPYQERFKDALGWAKLHGLSPAFEDATQVCLILVDVQNTFCLPNFELFVRDRSGTGAVDDNIRPDDAFSKFMEAGMNVVQSTTPILDWP